MINILKSGSWALEGVHVVEVAEGEVLHFSADEEFKMVEAGWAEWMKEAAVEAFKEVVAVETARKPKAK
jgi:hypothetical protein